jgi:hypothetical protein
VVPVIKVMSERAKVFVQAYDFNKSYRHVGLYGILQKESAVLQENVP